MRSHFVAVGASAVVLLGLIALPFIDSFSGPSASDLPTDGDAPRAPQDVGEDAGGEGVEGPSTGIPDSPSKDAAWGRELQPFTGGSAKTVRALADRKSVV